MTPHRYTFAIRYRIPGLELKIAKSLKLKYHSGNHLIENYILNNATERKFDSIRWIQRTLKANNMFEIKYEIMYSIQIQ